MGLMRGERGFVWGKRGAREELGENEAVEGKTGL